MSDDVTWPQTSKSWPQYLWSLISQKPCEICGRFKLTTYRKPHIANPMVTWQMTSRDPKRSRSWPRRIWSSISQQPCEINGWVILTTNRKPRLGSWESSGHMTDDVTWPERSKSWPQYLWSLISLKYGEKQTKNNETLSNRQNFGTRYRKSKKNIFYYFDLPKFSFDCPAICLIIFLGGGGILNLSL